MDQCDICDEKSVIYEDRQRIECYIVVTQGCEPVLSIKTRSPAYAG